MGTTMMSPAIRACPAAQTLLLALLICSSGAGLARKGAVVASDHAPLAQRNGRSLLATFKTTSWACLRGIDKVADVDIWWGFTANDAAYACNNWVPGACANACNASPFAWYYCWKGGVTVAAVPIWWGYANSDASWACNTWRSLCANGACTTTPVNDGNRVMIAYYGAYPGGLPPPDLAKVPLPPAGVDFYIALSFAREGGDGNFAFYDGIASSTIITKSMVAAAKARGLKFMVVLAGDSLRWGSVSSSWVSNAVSSLTTLIDTWKLDGVDVNYETTSNNWDGFADNMCNVVTQLKQKRNIKVSIAPFSATDAPYLALWDKCKYIGVDWINFQVYANERTTVDQTTALVVDNMQKYRPGPGSTMVGFATSTTAPRGVDASASVVVMSQLNQRVRGAFIWSLEDSYKADSTFKTVTNLMNALLPA